MSLMLKELREAPQVYDRCIASGAKEAEIAAACTFADVNNIVTAARGTSHHAAIFFKQLTELAAGLPVSHAAPYVLTAEKAPLLLFKTLFLVISQSGQSPDTLAMLRHAKDCGALVCSLTNNAESPVAREATISLDMLAGAENAVAATKTFSGELVRLAMLAEALSGKTLVSRNVGEITQKLLTSYVPKVDELLCSSKHLVSLSRGITEALARECALKFMECTYKFSFASSTNEFKHGPQALVEKDTPVLLFAPSGKYTADFVSTAKTLTERGAHLIAFSDLDEVLSLASLAVEMPKLDAVDAMLVYTPIMQLFVEACTEHLGLSPDAPRNLNKVTVTN